MKLAFVLGWLLIAWPVAALGQVSGFVESIGFDNRFRPDCWTPMLINLSSQNPRTETYQIQIVQEDLDKDSVTYTRDVTLNANVQQKFWAYFLPQPTNGGLPTTSVDALDHVLKVYLCEKPATAGGRGKQIMKLPVRFVVSNLDPPIQNGDHVKGRKLVLWVTDGSSRVAWQEYDQVFGTMEDVSFVQVRARDLPENALGYDAVDAILWLSGNADELSEGGSTRKDAIVQWVHAGGTLVACQTQRLHQLDNLADLLPINPRQVQLMDHHTLEPLEALARPRAHFGQDLTVFPLGSWWGKQNWASLARQQTWRFARTKPLDNTAVEDWIDWTASELHPAAEPATHPTAAPTEADARAAAPVERSPWLVRRAVGLGCVTWVAQDLGDPALAGKRDSKNNLISPSFGWTYVWDHVFGWNNATYLGPKSDKIDAAYQPQFTDSTVDAGAGLFGGTQFEGKGFTLMGIAIVFFIIYWLVAGPGSYFYLARQHRRHLSWIVFGAAAVAAALLTVVLVKAVLRGSPELKHRSLVRRYGDEPVQVRSRVGLYIPRDGMQSIELHDASPTAVSMLTPLIRHPESVSDTEFPAAQEYVIPVRDPGDPSLSVQVPFRSTLKNLEARWVGDLSGGISGSPRLLAGSGFKDLISGTLTNDTGDDLYDVYFFFNHPGNGNIQTDWGLYVTDWKKGAALDLFKEFNAASTFNNKGDPDGKHGSVKGLIDAPSGWYTYWYLNLSGLAGDDNLRISLPVLTMFDRLPPPRKDSTLSQKLNRFDLHRRGGRDLNRSQSLLAGQLVVVGLTRGPNPCPMTVNGTTYPGDGLTGVQVVLPLDRSQVSSGQAPYGTPPATAPAATPGESTSSAEPVGSRNAYDDSAGRSASVFANVQCDFRDDHAGPLPLGYAEKGPRTLVTNIAAFLLRPLDSRQQTRPCILDEPRSSESGLQAAKQRFRAQLKGSD